MISLFRRRPQRIVHALSTETLDRLERIAKINAGWIRPKLPAPPEPPPKSEWEIARDAWLSTLDPIASSHYRALFDIATGRRAEEPHRGFTRAATIEALNSAGAPTPS